MIPYTRNARTHSEAQVQVELAGLLAYCDVAVKRWSKFTGRAAVLADDGRTFDELVGARSQGVAPLRRSSTPAASQTRCRPTWPVWWSASIPPARAATRTSAPTMSASSLADEVGGFETRIAALKAEAIRRNLHRAEGQAFRITLSPPHPIHQHGADRLAADLHAAPQVRGGGRVNWRCCTAHSAGSSPVRCPRRRARNTTESQQIQR